MKIAPVSKNNFTASTFVENYDQYFLYNKKQKSKKDNNKLLQQYSLATAATAVTAVTVALYNLGKRRKFHSNIVEVPDLARGLNVIKNHEEAINFIKSKFIYPIKASDLGDNKIVKSKDFKSGLIITGKNKIDLRKISVALKEHFDMLDIDTVFLKQSLLEENHGLLSSRRVKKNDLVKKFFTEAEKAKEKYKNTGKYTVISLGRFEDYTSLKITKSTQSKLDDLVTSITPEKYPGVIWYGWTTESTSLPLYLSDLPVLIAKVES